MHHSKHFQDIEEVENAAQVELEGIPQILLQDRPLRLRDQWSRTCGAETSLCDRFYKGQGVMRLAIRTTLLYEPLIIPRRSK